VSLVRRAAKRDASEAAIVEYLRKAGWSVLKLSVEDGPDFICGKLGVGNVLVEVKSGNAKLRPGQQKFRDEWKGDPVYVLRCIEDAMALERAIRPVGRVSFKARLAERVLKAFDACVYCGVRHGDNYPPPRVQRKAWLEVEHIVPVSRGGTNDLSNLTVACKSCNRSKRSKTAAEFGYPNIRTALEALGNAANQDY
jgi:5-methylcytosine-specific restriction endonuclease McrA